METLQVTNQEVRISEAFGLTEAQVAVIKANTAKNTTNMELSYFISVCKSMELNPFNKEVWCYKDHKQNLLIFAGRDGFLAKAQRNPLYDGIRSSEVCKNDEIELNIPLGEIHHKINPKEPRGEIIGAYAIVFRKDGEPTVEWAAYEVYNRALNGNYKNAWNTHPAEMIKKVAETHALKKAFGISGLQSEYDWKVEDSIAEPINTKPIDIIVETAKSYMKDGGNMEIVKKMYPSLTPEQLKEIEDAG